MKRRAVLIAVLALLQAAEASAQSDKPDPATIRARLALRHQSRAVWVHGQLKLRPDQEDGWRAMIAVLAPDRPPSPEREGVIRRFHASLDPAQRQTFDRLVDWAKPRASTKD